MVPLAAWRVAAIALSCCALLTVARADDPVPPETRLVAASNAPVTAPGPLSFTITSTEDLVLTLTDLQVPGALVSANAVVTQAGAIAASAQLAAPATSATASLPAASGPYTLYVFGVPNASYSVGTFSACIAPKATPANCIQTASLSGNLTAQSVANDPTVSTLSTPLVVTTAGAYTFNFADLQFPVALATPPTLALFQGSTAIFPPGQSTPGITPGTMLNLSPGTYNLLAIAQADATAQSGLYGVTIVGATGSAALLDTTVPVGLTTVNTPFANPSAQSVTLTVNDYAFPGPLNSASALLTAGGTVLGTASAAGGAATFTAPAATLALWTYGSAGSTAGTFSATVVAGTTNLYTTAQGVGPVGSGYAYAFVAPVAAAGSFQAAAADLQFPSQLGSLSFAAAQNGVVLAQSATAGSLNISAVAGDVILLVSAQAPTSQAPTSGSATSGNGLFDVNLQTSGASAALVYDKTQSVSASPALFDAQALTLGVNASFDAQLTDLKFPAAFDTLALVVSRGSEIIGKVYGGGTFSFAGSPGTYQLTFVATPAAQQQFGMYSVAVTYSAPTVTLSSSAATAATGSAVTLSWASTAATSCTASGGNFTGNEATTGMQSVIVDATATYTLTCTGQGGTASQAVTVTATTAAAKSGGGGGGSVDPAWLLLATGLLLWRCRGLLSSDISLAKARSPDAR